jgi:hypothetical protein
VAASAIAEQFDHPYFVSKVVDDLRDRQFDRYSAIRRCLR